MQLASKATSRFNHQYLGTEHILLGLLQEGSWVVEEVLSHLHVDPRQLRSDVENLLQGGPEMIAMGRPPSKPRAKDVIQFSMAEAGDLNHNYVGVDTSPGLAARARRRRRPDVEPSRCDAGKRASGHIVPDRSLAVDHPTRERRGRRELKGIAAPTPAVCPYWAGA